MYLKAYLHGDYIESASRLAECLLVGYGCEQNIDMFWQIAKKAYDNMSSSICFILGKVYQEGKICPPDLKKAKEYYEEGIKRGNEKCKKALAELE
jgi:TPR repeat protein